MAKIKTATVRVSHNIWGNYGLFIGTTRVDDTGEYFYAREWLAHRILEGIYKVSSKSVITQAEAMKYIKSIVVS